MLDDSLKFCRNNLNVLFENMFPEYDMLANFLLTDPL